MKKVFVSVPMRGRNESDIQDSIERMFTIAKAIWGEDLAMVNNFLPEPIQEAYGKKRPSMYYLGEAIKKMSDCDYFIGPNWELVLEFPGCRTERECAEAYGLQMAEVNMRPMCPDIGGQILADYGMD